ncbi:MAG TPA: hypothetical protein EYG73_07655 [Arcobacter sp.]|nr:hypothetical protein [Arcobacter sp.]
MNLKSFYRYIFLLLVSVVFFTGCGSDNERGGSGFSSAPSNDDGTYSLVSGKNSAVMGALKNATVKAYTYSDLDTVISETTTGDLGEFSLTLNNVDDSELLLVTVKGGFDIDTNDDGIIDDEPTENKGTIRGWVKASDLKNGSANITLLSEIVYNYTSHLIGQVHVEDFEQALDTISSILFNKNDLNATYSTIKTFDPTKSELKNKMSFNYADLIKENSFLSNIYSDTNNTVLTTTLDNLLKTKLSFNRNDLIKVPSHYKVSLIPGIKTDFSADNVDIYLRRESNQSKLTAFIPVDSNLTFTAIPSEEMKIIDWDGCNKISEDRTQCTIINIQESKTIMPRIQYKESIYSDNVKDLTGYVVNINDNNYTVNLDLDTNTETRNFIENIRTDDIIIKRDGEDRFFRKVVSVSKVDNYNYIIVTDDMSFLEVYQQGGMSLNRNLTHEDLADDLDSINRSLQASNAILLPPKHKNDDKFTIVFLDDNSSINRSIVDTGEISVLLYDDGNENQIGMKGSITFQVSCNFDYNTKYFNLESMRMVTTTTLTSDVTLFGKASFVNGAHEKPLIKNADGTAKTFHFKIPSGWLMLQAEIGFYYGVKGDVSSEISLGGKVNSVNKFGINVYQGNVHKISSSTFDTQIIGDLKATANVFGYLKATPGIDALHIAGMRINFETGLDISGSSSLADEKFVGKVDWKNVLTPSFYIPYPLDTFTWAKKLEKEINEDVFGDKIGLTFTKNLYTHEIGKTPALLESVIPDMNMEVYSDADGVAESYNLIIKNIGEEKLKWKIETNGTLGPFMDIQTTNGELAKDETIDVIVNFSFDGVSDLVGENLEGYINIINETNNLGSVENKVTLEVIPRLATPSNLIQVFFSGISTTFINFELPNYVWDDFTGYYDDRGFKIFSTKEVNGECGRDYQLFHSIDVINNREEIFEHQLTKVNLKEKMERLNLEYGNRYCFKLSSYLKGYSSESTPTSKYYIPNLGSIKTSIKDRNNNPIVNARVHLTSTFDNSVADGDGNVIFENLIPGTYLMTVEADGFINTPSQVIVNEGEETLFEGIRVIEEELEGLSGIINGKIINAVNSSNIANVSIEVRAGNSNTSGEVIDSTTTDSNGQYSLTLPTGNYTFNIVKSGYTSSTLNVLSIGNETTTQDLSLSPILSSGEMRIVLRWGDTPSDLDSHLVKKTDGVQDYHIYYSNPTSGADSLDRDDTDGVGPETVTISNVDTSSVYTYYVYNYSHNNNTELKNSSATIDISYGNNTDRRANPPRAIPNEDGYYWKVFEIVNGEVVFCTIGCVQDDTSTLIRSIDRGENELFGNLPSKN